LSDYSLSYPPECQRNGDKRVVRGGSYWNNARNCRVANRNNHPTNRNDNIGFRVVLSPSPKMAG
jgi:formylglycine-generating enzyme required for sulfatase activity